jgi:hypothetical protein
MTEPREWPFPCPLRRCKGVVPASMPVCFSHWFMAPQDLRDAVNRAIRKGDDDELAASAVLVAALRIMAGERG